MARFLLIFSCALSLSSFLLSAQSWTWVVLVFESSVYLLLVMKKLKTFLQWIAFINGIIGFLWVFLFQALTEISIWWVNLGCFLILFIFEILVPTVLFIMEKAIIDETKINNDLNG